LPAAFDRETGKLVHKRVHGWRRDAGGVVGGYEALLADGQIYSLAAHHVLALDERTGDVGFGWFAGRRMAAAGETAYLATGTELLRVHREVYAAASRARHTLELEVKDKGARLQRLASPKSPEEEEEAQGLRSRIAVAKGEIEVLSRRGVLWSAPSALDADLIVAGDLAIAGGAGAVALHRIADGGAEGKLDVEGEARHLAAADGHLFVSTSAGKVYAFAAPRRAESSGTEARGEKAATGEKPATEAKAATEEKPATGAGAESPFPPDALTARYAEAAASLLRDSGVTRGFALVLGNGDGRLSYELARQSGLKIYAVDPDPERVAASRRALLAAGLYGHRVTVHCRDLDSVPYASYFANLIVSDDLVTRGRMPRAALATAARCLKPHGGVVCLGRRAGAPGALVEAGELRELAEGLGLGDEAREARAAQGGDWAALVRGALPGTGSWSHQYGEPGNTASSGDERIKGGLSVLWYGDPGPGKMVNRHEGAVGPVAVSGRFFLHGETTLMAYDTYNGLFLWERENAEAVRTGVFQNASPANLVASEDRVFYLSGPSCIELDAASGELKREHPLPPSKDASIYEWSYVAHDGGLLFGTATRRRELEKRLVRRGIKTEDATDAIFAIDLEDGRLLWTYEGKSIEARTIAIGRGRVFFVDSSVTSEERAAILGEEKSHLEKLEGKERELAEERLKQADVRAAVALDARTGEKRWSAPVDVTDCSDIGTGGGKLTVIYKDDVLVFCGANANGHYWKQFLQGEFSRRRLVALSAANGYKLWAKDANYRHRPIIVGDRVIAEPWTFDLKSGEQILRAHPLTGEKVPWSIIRPGHHCGMISAAASMLFFRSGYTGFYDLESDSGTRHFAGHRLGCWINAIPADGIVLIPEASAGCVCLFSISSTIALEPRPPRRPWSIASAVGATLPVKRMAVNLAAPGDRRDDDGVLWLAYPRPVPGIQTGLDLAFTIPVEFVQGGSFAPSLAGPLSAEAKPDWLFHSGARGLTRCSLPLVGEEGPPGVYDLKLYFRAEHPVPPFAVRTQGEAVIPELSGAGAFVAEAAGIRVERDLVLELASADGNRLGSLPALCAVHVERRDGEGEGKR
jgi:outer membrane protein assembly factor BamB